jgi:CDP-4-dehydro-6-deoxyglucose reductase
MSTQPRHTGTVVRIELAAANTRRFFIKTELETPFVFRPGQFVTLDLPIHDKPARRLRSYSIASCPDDTNVFELCIVLQEGGAGTHYLFNEVQEGASVLYIGPLGNFTLPEVIEKELFLICTGTGIAPFRSMLHYIHRHNVPHKGIHLIFGTRKRENLLYFDELMQLADVLPGFHFIPTLSREEWTGQTGYVHVVYESILKRRIEEKGSAEACEAAFMLCGWKDMVSEAMQKLIEMGFNKNCIRRELYG